jgi:folylpolyglutamate synthase
MYDSAAVVGLTMQNSFAEKWKSLDPKACVLVVPSIEEALDYVKVLATGDETVRCPRVQVLITGSLHLVGGALAVLEDAVTL